MPWKETCVMEKRYEFVLRALGKEKPFEELCREYGVSAKTGYKWKARFLNEGLGGLADESRRPHRSPEAVREEEVCLLVELKLAHPHWGPEFNSKVLPMS